ncbi:MAG: hypothetical protein ABIA63_04525, partial [bacterium]
MDIHYKLKIAGFLFFHVCYFCNSSLGCSNPVYRYALERWEPAPITLLIFYKDSLNPAQKYLYDKIDKMFQGTPFRVNIYIQSFNIKDSLPPGIDSVWMTNSGNSLPAMVVCSPGFSMHRNAIWNGHFNNDNFNSLINSRVRQRIAGKILRGTSVVWLLIKGNDRKANRRAADSLRIYLREFQEKFADSLDIPELGPEFDKLRHIPSQLKFEIVQISYRDRKEGVFLKMLYRLGGMDLKLIKLPAVFPIYGRGRVYKGLERDKITGHEINKICEFLTGPCYCSMRGAQTGKDFLAAVNWEGALNGTVDADKAVGLEKSLFNRRLFVIFAVFGAIFILFIILYFLFL